MEDNIFTTVKGFGQAFCHTCLSDNRLLFPLGKYSDVYYTLFSNLASLDFLPQKLICWECAAILKKIKLFQAKVEHAQMLLTSHRFNQQTPFPSLSSLKSKLIGQEFNRIIEYEDSTDDKSVIVPLIQPDDIDEKLVYLPTTNTEVSNKEAELTETMVEFQIKDEKTDERECEIDSNEFFAGTKSEDEENKLVIDDTRHTKNINNKRKPPVITKYKKFKINDEITIKKLMKSMCKITYVQFGEVKDFLEQEKESVLFKHKFKCKSCVLSWPRVEDFKNHNEKFHNGSSKFLCEYCQSTFKNKSGLRGHLKKHLQIVECLRCGFITAGKYRMALHLAEEHRTICSVCQATFRHTSLFYKHYNDLHKYFKCDYCGATRRIKRALEKHIISTHQDKHKCEICNIYLKNRKSYVTHYKRQHVVTNGEDSYCVECDRQFPNKTMYRYHVNSSAVHLKDKEGYRTKLKCSCPDCGKNYATREAMRNHYNYVHLKQSNYVCQICNRQFLNRTKYVNHVQKEHEGKKAEKNKFCTFCGRGFSTNRILTHHIRTHTGERPFACAHCPARFAQPHAARAHLAHVHLRVKRNRRAQ